MCVREYLVCTCSIFIFVIDKNMCPFLILYYIHVDVTDEFVILDHVVVVCVINFAFISDKQNFF